MIHERGPRAFTSFSGVTSATTGDALDLGTVCTTHTLMVFYPAGGINSALQVAMEGSHDGTTWHEMRTVNRGIVTQLDVAARYVRARAYGTSGGEPVTATIASA